MLPPSTLNCPRAPPTLSEAVALSVPVADTVAPFKGAVMFPAGGVVSGGGGGGAFATVTVTGAEVVRLPAASRATALIVCVPFAAPVVFQEIEYGALVSSAPKLTPSILNCTPATPTLSEAVALSVTVADTVAPFKGELMFTAGGVVSGGGGGGAFATVTVTGAEVVRLPAASRATALIVCEPLAAPVVFQEIEYGALVSSAPKLAPSILNCTPATPMLSEAAALSVTVAGTVAPFKGAVMFTAGGVVSGGGGGAATVAATPVRP